MTGQLFTHYFLTDGIKTTPEWQASVDQPEAFAAFRNGVARHHDALSRSRNPNEARTEEELIRPVLELLGWTEYMPQPSAAGHEDIPDHLLFADAESKARAGNPFQYATVVEESKRFGLALDSRDRSDRAQRGTPHGQILRYLATASPSSGTKRNAATSVLASTRSTSTSTACRGTTPRPRHLPHRLSRRRSRLRNIPHPRYDAGVYECAGSGGYGDESGGVDWRSATLDRIRAV